MANVRRDEETSKSMPIGLPRELLPRFSASPSLAYKAGLFSPDNSVNQRWYDAWLGGGAAILMFQKLSPTGRQGTRK